VPHRLERPLHAAEPLQPILVDLPLLLAGRKALQKVHRLPDRLRRLQLGGHGLRTVFPGQLQKVYPSVQSPVQGVGQRLVVLPQLDEVDLELVQKLASALHVLHLVDVVVGGLVVELVEVQDVDADGLGEKAEVHPLVELVAVKSAPVVERALGEPVFRQHLHLDVVPRAVPAQSLHVEDGALVLQVLLLVVGVLDLDVGRPILLRDDRVDQVDQYVLALLASEELFEDEVNPRIHFAHRASLLSAVFIVPAPSVCQGTA